MTIEERISDIEEEIRSTSYNKATQHHIGKLKAKLAQLKEDVIKRKSSGKKGAGFSVKKSGDATIVLVGFPSVGKSTLLNQLTDAGSRVAEYEFTTLNVTPGMMVYEGVRIQVLDIPGIITGASTGKGRGKEVLSIVRNSDLILIILEVKNLMCLESIERELYDVGIRLNQNPPKVRVTKTDRGGIKVSSTTSLSIDKKMIRGVLNVYGIHNAQVTIHEDINVDQLIDVVMKNRVYLPSITVLNKVDLVDDKNLGEIRSIIKKDILQISAEKNLNLDKLRKEIFRKLRLIRIYTKRQGQKIYSSKPLIMGEGSTVRDVCGKLHREIREKFRYAILSGKSAKFDSQVVGLNHVLEDKDVLSIVTER
ncbi:MAG: GTP-binding protein [Candidatus Altiarchaeota archaeon]|nr:GTP-binding protein [Candidatus Altiarchaeota archaeon]